MHIPVLLHEVIETLKCIPGMTVIDATTNGGGHAREIIKRIFPGGVFVGIDWDREIIERTEKEIRTEFSSQDQSKLKFVWSNYADIQNVCEKEKITSVNAIIADLGFSSLQIESPQRGMSFMREGPLDMRYNISSRIPAYEVINSFSKEALADIIHTYGEERYARAIAEKIVIERKKERIYTTRQLAELIEQMVPQYKRGGIHPATRTFQALRIYVNGEFENIQKLLTDAPSILAPQGRLGIITFHSLEDRRIKQGFKDLVDQGIGISITKRPLIPTEKDIQENPRARSAKLRVFEKI
ncbi:MAG: 16S rRNA (cytosine(1402)-N(4))-methyltransferase RsmH [Candidatus Paceibacterota bacterium]